MAAMYPEGTQDYISKGATEEVQKALSGRLGRVLEAELDAVGAKVGGEPGRVILAAIRQAARRAVAGMTMAELDPAKYARAAAKAQKDYLEAIATGEGAIAAFQAKRNHAWALEMWRAAGEAQAKVESIRKYLDTFSKDSEAVQDLQGRGELPRRHRRAPRGDRVQAPDGDDAPQAGGARGLPRRDGGGGRDGEHPRRGAHRGAPQELPPDVARRAPGRRGGGVATSRRWRGSRTSSRASRRTGSSPRPLPTWPTPSTTRGPRRARARSTPASPTR